MILVLLLFSQIVCAQSEFDTNYFKIYSSIYYSGNGEVYSYADEFLVVTKEAFGSGKLRFKISSQDHGALAFISDMHSKQVLEIEGEGEDVEVCKHVSGVCSKCLSTIVKDNIGKVWDQKFELTDLGKDMPCEIEIQLVAKEFNSESLGRLIAVRALSKEFGCLVKDENQKKLKARINAVYVFDDDFEEVYLGLSSFSATDKTGLFGRKRLRHEVGIYRADEQGNVLDLGLKKNPKINNEFAKFISKIGLTKKAPNVKTTSELPRWAKEEGLKSSQTANICAAMACEGASNPVATFYLSMNKMLSMQTLGLIEPVSMNAVYSTLSSVVNTVGGLSAVTLAEAGVATAAAAEAVDRDGHSKKPATPYVPVP